MSAAASARRAKLRHPDEFCKNPRCLWRTPDEYCPRHTPRGEDLAPQVSHSPAGMSGTAPAESAPSGSEQPRGAGVQAPTSRAARHLTPQARRATPACENCGRSVGPGGGYPPPGYTTANSEPGDAWCEACRFGATPAPRTWWERHRSVPDQVEDMQVWGDPDPDPQDVIYDPRSMEAE